ncbi:MAG: RdgB/HAM1 family non-canonical purine NTP pyrophosphatase [Treponema sp.]|nr:RdgB/HAM1 family non-canonical purine NTP pyrophosphatase [Treponema sp.]
MIIWLATANVHKRDEFARAFPNHTLILPAEKHIAFEPIESGTSFVENALIKAETLYRTVKAPVIADDSGLCVEALNGRPGIHSSRYGAVHNGTLLTDTERNHLLLHELTGIHNRAAHFVCTLVFYTAEHCFFTVQQRWNGLILSQEQGKNGFGYDPIFFVPECACSVAELSEAEKSSISHRGKAAYILNHCLDFWTF